MVWLTLAVMEFLALKDDIIIVDMTTLVKKAFNIYMLLCANIALQQNTFPSSKAYYVHALLYNAENRCLRVNVSQV
jgi:hypothetical protein